MKLNKLDLKKLQDKGLPINKRHILDMEKYNYWYYKTDEYAEKITQSQNDKDAYIENFRQSILCTFEMNKYQIIQRREFLLLFSLLKAYNKIDPTHKLYMNHKGHQVKKNDRRAINERTLKSKFD